MAACNHKTLEDHSYLTEHGRVWICSNCGERQRWGRTWAYWGDVECKQCGFARIYWVACSDACVQALQKRKKS